MKNKNYILTSIHFDAAVGLPVSAPLDSDLLRFVFDCIASTVEGKKGSISKKEALQLSGIPKEETEGFVITAWKLPKPIDTVQGIFATWLMVWLEKEEGTIEFGFFAPEDDPDGLNEFLNGKDRGFDLALIS